MHMKTSPWLALKAAADPARPCGGVGKAGRKATSASVRNADSYQEQTHDDVHVLHEGVTVTRMYDLLTGARRVVAAQSGAASAGETCNFSWRTLSGEKRPKRKRRPAMSGHGRPATQELGDIPAVR
jgi:hypothetical protein